MRQCAGCGRRAPQCDLVRFVAGPDGQLTALAKGGGRGAYTCRAKVCFERAAARRAFARTLKQAVAVDPSLAPDDYTGS